MRTPLLALLITVLLGVLTTGSGPHAGDNSDAKALAPRNGLNQALLQDIHSIPAYITFGLTVLLARLTVTAEFGALRLTVSSVELPPLSSTLA